MATDLENLQTRKSAILSELAAMGTKPDYSINGQSVQWTAYRKSLLEELEMINGLIERELPFELRSQVL